MLGKYILRNAGTIQVRLLGLRSINANKFPGESRHVLCQSTKFSSIKTENNVLSEKVKDERCVKRFSCKLEEKNSLKVMFFKCGVCETANLKSFSKLAYEKGVVIVQCDGCKKYHLVADHLGWYDSQKPPGKIVDFMREKEGHVYEGTLKDYDEFLKLNSTNGKIKITLNSSKVNNIKTDTAHNEEPLKIGV